MDTIYDLFYENQLILIILSFCIAFYSSTLVKSSFTKYSKVPGSTSMTGIQVAEKIMHANNVFDVKIEITNNFLGDHFDPKAKVVRLSPDVANSNSVAAQAVAAHEIGHVLQYDQGSKLISIRNAFLPLAQLSSKAVWGLILLGIYFQMSGMLTLGIAAFTMILLFQVATLPVEFDASARAMTQLKNLSITTPEFEAGVKKVLSAAALTYVVAVITSLLTLLRFLAIRDRR